MYIQPSGPGRSRKIKKTELTAGDVIAFDKTSNCIFAGRQGTPLLFSLDGDDKFRIHNATDCLADFLRLISDLYGVVLKKVPSEKYGNGSNDVWEATKKVFVKGKGYVAAETAV